MFCTVSIANLRLLQPGEGGEILHFTRADEQQQTELRQQGIIPGKQITVIKRYPVLLVEVSGQKIRVPDHLSSYVRVKVFDNCPRYPPSAEPNFPNYPFAN
ncbi:MAG: FeoA family protein [Pseudanabaenaceae cyanobacterium SKYGB_i_bin29]|nr:ferrous iron transport protein A [Pseudanabaenaceae cyanobacterium SKYG29]MDW8422241.1 FeoA family protein [Pseudanabaenaceae cyanobacterium SKYGB_i_bin29]